MEYGLIGGRLGHSYSKVIHEMLCGYRYDLCPLPTEEEVRAFMTRRQFRAINVTIPYKLVVMEYCSYIDPHAKAINAVNTIVNRNGLLYGYNTDYPGFSYLCDAHGVEFKPIIFLICINSERMCNLCVDLQAIMAPAILIEKKSSTRWVNALPTADLTAREALLMTM